MGRVRRVPIRSQVRIGVRAVTSDIGLSAGPAESRSPTWNRVGCRYIAYVRSLNDTVGFPITLSVLKFLT